LRLNRQLLILVLAALLPLVVLTAVLGSAALNQSQREMQRDASGRVSVLSSEMERELEAQVEVLQAVANSPVLDGPLDLTRFGLYGQRLLDQQHLWISVCLLSPTGERLARVGVAPPGGTNHVLDQAGFDQALKSGGPVIGRFVRPPGNVRPPAFAIFAPVIRDGRIRYVVSAVIAPTGVNALLVRHPLPKGWISGVLDRRGVIIARNERSQEFLGRLGSPPALAATRRGGDGVYSGTSVDGHRYVTAYRTLPGSGWSVHIAIPRETYAAPMRREAVLVGGGGALGLLLISLFLGLLSRELDLRQRQAAAIEEGRRLEALGRMTGGVAHDFNNILMVVQGSAELLRRRLAGDARAETLSDAILAGAKRGQTLTRQLLAFGRKSSHRPVSFRIQDRADQLLALVQRAAPAQIAAEVEIPASTWPVHADPAALEVALLNLAVNARDAISGAGSIIIGASNISLQKGRDEGTDLVGDFVAVWVADDGAGIPEEHAAHIFEPFYTTKPAGQGTGLGLSQVYGFAKQSGGAVRVNSKVGEGTTVIVYLPRGEETSAEPEPSQERPLRRDDGRVLLVEDNPDVALVTGAMLEAIGYGVVHAQDAATALRRLQSGEVFDILFSDIVMAEGMSGLELADRVREIRQELPVLLATGYSEALASGAQHGFRVLAKPFGEAELAAALFQARRDMRAVQTPERETA
jgi:signal transduction histidine kinase/ActR/RegA family two-component response regulator